MLDEATLVEHRPTLVGVCYRMLGCPFAAQDVAQEALDRAWRNRHTYDPARASVGTWLYRIATNACLDEMRRSRRRALPADLSGPAEPRGDMGRPLAESAWVQPAPTAMLAAGGSDDPADRVVRDESVRLAFVAALQQLTPVERAALILRRVLGWAVPEAAPGLDRSTAAVNSALQRARAKLDRAAPPAAEAHAPGDPAQSELLERYVRAFEAYDVATLTALLHRDATMSMPPFRWWLRGADRIEQALRSSSVCQGARLVPIGCNGVPAFGQYLPLGPEGTLVPWALVLVETGAGRIRSLTSYLWPERLFALAGLPPTLDASSPDPSPDMSAGTRGR